MPGLPRRLPFLHVTRLVLVSILLALLVPASAQADVGVVPILPGGSSLMPDEATPIQMAAEVVTMHVRPATEADNTAVTLNPEAYGFRTDQAWYQVVADVQADFTMKNPTSEAVSMTVWFPLASVLKSAAWYELNPDEIVPRIEGFMVSADGIPADYTVIELPNPNGTDKPDLPWASFPITFSAGKETMIQVSYVLPLARPAKSNALVLYYIFQTGAGWAGPIGQAELIVNLPYPASEETMSGMPADSLYPPYFIYRGDEIVDIPPNAVMEGNQARWLWEDWEPGPEDDFALLLMHPATWNGLQNDRAVVKSRPEDGQAWWKLCDTYHWLSTSYHAAIRPSYCAAYPPQGIDACQEAARLLPGDAAPHYVLAWFNLPALVENPSLKTLEPVLVQLKLGQALEAVQPPSKVFICDPWMEMCNADYIEAGIANAFPGTPDPAWVASISEKVSQLVAIELENATATAISSTETAHASATPTSPPSATASTTAKPTLTSSPSATLIPSTTPQPTPTILPATTEMTSNWQRLILFVAAGVIGLVVVGFLVVRILRNRDKG